jgi:3',5'-cyclic-AMP phosphodiesterase
LITILLVTGSCDKFEFSPHQVLLRDNEKNLNEYNAERIRQLGLQPGDTIRIALISDTQRFYDETDQVVDAINQRTVQPGKRIHFAIHGGDISDFGLMDEFRWIHERLSKLKMPYLSVIGNHDCVANGKRIFEKMYGPFDYTFEIAGNRFVFLNTNFLEFDNANVPNLEYFESSLRDRNNYRNAFVVAHVPPFDLDFDRSKELPFARIVRDYNVKYGIFGHQHNHRIRQPYEDNRNYLVIGSVEKHGYVVMTIVGEKVSYEVIPF